MLLIPAIDLKDGKCVRLVRGEFDQATVYGHDPAIMALHWESQGAEWIHLVDLDASLGESGNRRAVESIRESVKAKLQLGGGIKDMRSVDFWIGAGIDRLIMGTALLEDPGLVRKAAGRHPGKIAAALDSKGTALRTWGWKVDAGRDLLETAASLASLGISLVIHTDVSRDGTQEGPNIPLTKEVAKASGLPTVISGGISGPGDLAAIRDGAPELYGAISGKALYAGTLSFGEGLAALAG
ncbi:MAG: 1-(5-phosphoribosyl)-5-((5-phosphoribosylamino)methylideneamino)imidazole-4-carboxamide isomerase [Deltaproteobacteria bacterium]|jgi:phosphoribosylformimino-5-aminoimidazole carboxamide ribotide isomerase|nr:1-(5-phosphoribosyl)-5-((5-phosphoribosylamino)methylideneamino)imidazole-4-carboxamide isomerase [Deltaproteobacteria bacterium]